jgi:hypothetical protein
LQADLIGRELAPERVVVPVESTEVNVLWTIFAILLIAWLLGLVGVYQIGSIIWLLLVAALVVLILQLATGRRTTV